MKNWLWERFLPMWAKQTLWKERNALEQENHRLKGRIRELESYIRGMHRALRENGKCKDRTGD